MDLLAEMDKIADERGWDPATRRDALEVDFRILLKRSAPELTAAHREYLFDVWSDAYTCLQSLREAERNAAARRCARSISAYCRPARPAPT